MRPAESNSFQLTGLYAVATATRKATKVASDVVMDVEILILLIQCYNSEISFPSFILSLPMGCNRNRGGNSTDFRKSSWKLLRSFHCAANIWWLFWKFFFDLSNYSLIKAPFLQYCQVGFYFCEDLLEFSFVENGKFRPWIRRCVKTLALVTPWNFIPSLPKRRTGSAPRGCEKAAEILIRPQKSGRSETEGEPDIFPKFFQRQSQTCLKQWISLLFSRNYYSDYLRSSGWRFNCISAPPNVPQKSTPKGTCEPIWKV